MSHEFPNDTESTNSFETHFVEREYIEVTGGEAEVLDIGPEKENFNIPILLAPGWAGTLELYKSAIKKLVEDNHRVVSLNHPRIGGDMEYMPTEILDGHPHEEVRKAMNLIDILDAKQIDRVDAIAHSEGAINLVIAASIYPERFRNIVLYAPAGLIGEDTFSRLLIDFTKFSLNGIDADKIIIAKKALKYIAQNPVRSFKEVHNIAHSQIHPLLHYLHDKNIGVVIMAAADDTVFPQEKMQEIVKADMIDGFLSVEGDHNDTPGPKHQYMSNAITGAEEMLTKLKTKQDLEKQPRQTNL